MQIRSLCFSLIALTSLVNSLTGLSGMPDIYTMNAGFTTWRCKIVEPSFPKYLTKGSGVLLAVLAPFTMAMGLDTPIAGALTMSILMIIVGVILVVGAVLWLSRLAAVRQIGMVLTVLALAVLLVLVIVLVIQPAEVAPAPESGTFKVLSVAGLGSGLSKANYTTSTKVFSTAEKVNTTAKSILGPKYFTANFTVQRTDAGATTDIKTISASVAQAQVTDPISGLTYYVIKPNTYGQPSCNWTMGGVSATYTLSAQLGLTPYATGVFVVNWTWNPSAFTTSNVLANDIVQCATITIGSETYTVQALIYLVLT